MEEDGQSRAHPPSVPLIWTLRMSAAPEGQGPGPGGQGIQGWVSLQGSCSRKPLYGQTQRMHRRELARVPGRGLQAHHGQVAQVLADLTPPL